MVFTPINSIWYQSSNLQGNGTKLPVYATTPVALSVMLISVGTIKGGSVL